MLFRKCHHPISSNRQHVQEGRGSRSDQTGICRFQQFSLTNTLTTLPSTSIVPGTAFAGCMARTANAPCQPVVLAKKSGCEACLVHSHTGSCWPQRCASDGAVAGAAMLQLIDAMSHCGSLPKLGGELHK